MRNDHVNKNEKIKKIAVVTGGSSGIGLELVKNLLDTDFFVVSVSRSAPPIESAAHDFFACDLSKSEQVKETAEKIVQKYPQIDLLVNNAGLGISGATELLPEEEIRYVFEVDYFSVLNFTRALLPAMQRGSKIVNISSACALFALPYRNIYCSAKAAVNMLSLGLRMELKKSGIAVVCVCPGDIKTSFTQNRIKYVEGGERYGDRVKDAQQKIDGREHKRMDPQKAAQKIARIAVKKKGALYIVGGKYKAFNFLYRIFPVGAFYGAVGKIFG